MDKAKVTVIYDEGALEGTNFIGAKGFSMLVEVDGEKTLVGTGLRERYLYNNLYDAGVNPESITRVVVSHNHPDHWGALPAVFRERQASLDVFAPVAAWGVKKFLGSTGMNFSEEVMAKIVRHDVAGWTQLSEHLFISAPLAYHEGNGEEVFVVIKTRNGPVLISGCCHCGLDHIFDAVRDKFGSYPVALLGGLHIDNRKSNLPQVYAEYLQTVGCRNLYLNHCTGVYGISKLRETLGLKGVNEFYVGQFLEFNIF